MLVVYFLKKFFYSIEIPPATKPLSTSATKADFHLQSSTLLSTVFANSPNVTQ